MLAQGRGEPAQHGGFGWACKQAKVGSVKLSGDWAAQ